MSSLIPAIQGILITGGLLSLSCSHRMLICVRVVDEVWVTMKLVAIDMCMRVDVTNSNPPKSRESEAKSVVAK